MALMATVLSSAVRRTVLTMPKSPPPTTCAVSGLKSASSVTLSERGLKVRCTDNQFSSTNASDGWLLTVIEKRLARVRERERERDRRNRRRTFSLKRFSILLAHWRGCRWNNRRGGRRVSLSYAIWNGSERFSVLAKSPFTYALEIGVVAVRRIAMAIDQRSIQTLTHWDAQSSETSRSRSKSRIRAGAQRHTSIAQRPIQIPIQSGSSEASRSGIRADWWY